MKTKVEYTDDKILIHRAGGTVSMNRTKDEDRDNAILADNLAMFEQQDFYNSEEFTDEFNKHLETAILATRGGGSGAVACRDTLLSLYNGYAYKANLQKWYSLDSNNRKALLFVLEHQTTCNRKDIDLYLLEYADDFKRMKEEVSHDQGRCIDLLSALSAIGGVSVRACGVSAVITGLTMISSAGGATASLYSSL